MSAVASRERRATAGQRMSSLVGKAQEDDDAFWGHETWAEDDSGNDSFRESDEDSEARADEFDSDFDDSETDNEAEEAAAGARAEAELQRQEKNQRRKEKFDVTKAGRDLMQKKKGKGKKRAMGDGINAGLVLNFPPAAEGSDGGVGAPVAATVPVTATTPKPKKAPTRRLSPRSPTAKKRSLRAATVTKSQEAIEKRKAAASATSASTTAKKKQKRFTQEELLLEAATMTEPENERWILARQRNQQQDEALQKALQHDNRGKVISRFKSRRGCLNSLTFPEMDHIPDILAKKPVAPKRKQVPTECVITGKKARYRDPKTMLGYHDAAAFKELRRRLYAGEPLDQRKKAKQVEKDVVMLDSERQNGEKATMANGNTSQQVYTSVATVAAAPSTVKPAAPSNQPNESTLVPSKPPAVAAPSKPTAPTALKTEKPDVTARSTSAGRSSPRKRKLSAKAIAAVETELFSPGKAQLSNVIRSMAMAPAETGATNGSVARDVVQSTTNIESAVNQPSTQRLDYTTKSASDPSV